jgi:hypothetical protein
MRLVCIAHKNQSGLRLFLKIAIAVLGAKTIHRLQSASFENHVGNTDARVSLAHFIVVK